MRLFLFATFVICNVCNVQSGWAQQKTEPIFSEHFGNVEADGLPVGWEIWNAKNMAQHFEQSDQIALTGGHSIRVSGNGKYHTKGSLKTTIKELKTGETYKVVVRYTTRGLTGGINSRVFPFVKWSSKKRWEPLVPIDFSDGWITAEVVHQLSNEADGQLTIGLFSGWIPEGSVYWDSVNVFHLPNYSPPPARKVNVAVIDERPKKVGTLMENCEFYVSQIAHACRQKKLDVICLTETFNELHVENDLKAAVSMDGEYMTKIRDVAREHQVNLVGGISELDGGVEFNTAFLINRQGKVVDKYRKAQLAVDEILFSDRSQGDELKVMQADFGKIGIVICWDYQFPEFARTLALQGAEILFVPIGGDGRIRESGVSKGMEHVGKTMAIENRIPIVFSRWAAGNPKSPSRIIDAKANVVALSNSDRFIAATVELNASVRHWSGTDFAREYFTSRRPELYAILADDRLRIRTKDGPKFVPLQEDSDPLP